MAASLRAGLNASSTGVPQRLRSNGRLRLASRPPFSMPRRSVARVSLSKSHHPTLRPAPWFARISAISFGPRENSPRRAFAVKSLR
jgi:hypothetical protein